MKSRKFAVFYLFHRYSRNSAPRGSYGFVVEQPQYGDILREAFLWERREAVGHYYYTCGGLFHLSLNLLKYYLKVGAAAPRISSRAAVYEINQ